MSVAGSPGTFAHSSWPFGQARSLTLLRSPRGVVEGGFEVAPQPRFAGI